MPTPESKEDIRKFLGFVQYLSRFITELSKVDAPLREVTRKDVDFYCDKPQKESFMELDSSAAIPRFSRSISQRRN